MPKSFGKFGLPGFQAGLVSNVNHSTSPAESADIGGKGGKSQICHCHSPDLILRFPPIFSLPSLPHVNCSETNPAWNPGKPNFPKDLGILVSQIICLPMQ